MEKIVRGVRCISSTFLSLSSASLMFQAKGINVRDFLRKQENEGYLANGYWENNQMMTGNDARDGCSGEFVAILF